MNERAKVEQATGRGESLERVLERFKRSGRFLKCTGQVESGSENPEGGRQHQP